MKDVSAEELIDKLVGAVAIQQHDHLPAKTLADYGVQATEAKAELLRRLSAPVQPGPRPNAKDKICAEIQNIMRIYREQDASSYGVDTPGGLEHMGDVWKLLGEWDRNLSASPRKILTNYDNPPIPDAHHLDWCAWFDGDEEGGPRGHGRTEAEAIADLKENYPELFPVAEKPDDFRNRVGMFMLKKGCVMGRPVDPAYVQDWIEEFALEQIESLRRRVPGAGVHKCGCGEENNFECRVCGVAWPEVSNEQA